MSLLRDAFIVTRCHLYYFPFPALSEGNRLLLYLATNIFLFFYVLCRQSPRRSSFCAPFGLLVLMPLIHDHLNSYKSYISSVRAVKLYHKQNVDILRLLWCN